MSLTDTSHDDDTSRRLQDYMFEDLIREALEMILLLFSDATKLQDIYGCKQEEHAAQLLYDPGADSIDKLTVAFKRFRIRGKMSKQASELYQKAKWSICDRSKFGIFVTEAKTLVDGLQEITKPLALLPQQKGLMTQAVGSIQDIRTHILIADVCEDDYPELSEVSARATEAASLLPEYMQHIDEWKLEVGTSSNTEDALQELESMTTTELKHRILQLTQQAPQEVAASMANFSYLPVFRKVWLCKNPPDRPGFLYSCEVCRNGKTYETFYSAALHLRRAHFIPVKRNRDGSINTERREVRGGMGGGGDPPMHVLKHYLYERWGPNVNGISVWEVVQVGDSTDAVRNLIDVT